MELVLPLLGKAAGADHEAAPEIAAGDQLLDEQARHDRLARARVVSEQEAERLARQHGLIDGRDLVRQWVHERGMHRQHGVEEVREADPVRLRHEAEECAVTVEAPRSAGLGDLQARLVVAIEDLVGDAAVGSPVDERQGVRPVPLDGDDRYHGVRQDAADGGVGLEVF